MMRGVIAGQPSPFPVAHRLPGVLQEDEFLGRFLGAFDEALAPLFLSLDGLGAYVDPQLAPTDFLDWLAQWVGIEVDEAWTVAQRREIVAGAVAVHARRGTTAGIAGAVRLIVDGEVEVTDNGGDAWSAEPGGALPGRARPRVTVRVRPRPGTSVDEARLDAVVTAVKPAHVTHRIRVVND
ncbi:phage tail protein [Ruania zhangjianzhongii]|uniref:phage tail protein n=1 Tax=Ruania zhangjianzhongii TaxID=2603206 RepID=UPI001FD60CE9|nr:phage tail protein [Ruania zhangjianzhongii]